MRYCMTALFLVAALGVANGQVAFTLQQTLDLSSPPLLALVGEHLQLVDATGDGEHELLIVDGGALETHKLQASGLYVEIASAQLPDDGTLAAVADLNGDGAVDAVVRMLLGYVVLFGDGTGAFPSTSSYTTLADTGQIVIGDFDGNGFRDIAAIRGYGTPFLGYYVEIDVRPGDGVGNFGPPIYSEFATDGLLNHAQVIDLDENGTDDVILSALEQLNFTFMANGSVSGVTTYPVGIDDIPRDFQIRDLNDDGHQDITFTCAGNSIVGVFLQDGTGLIGPFSEYPVNGSTFTIRVEDLNGDDIPDLLTTSDVALEWRLGVGDGTFGPSSSMPMNSPESRLAAGDSTGDGLADAAVLSGNTVSVLQNTTASLGSFRRGDVNVDGSVDITDAVVLLENLFVTGSPVLNCPDGADTNDDATVDVSDAVSLLSYLFVPASPEPPTPGTGACGADPTADTLPECMVGCP
ncbi:MAG: FG-GAP-like repeat-containing protein [Planctomycetota bacterium]